MVNKENPLGRQTQYPDHYDAALLFPISRSDNRKKLGLEGQGLPFFGVDIWNAYEVSWLDLNGKPQVRIVRFDIPCDTANIVESKSLKLYLNSFNQTRLDNQAVFKSRLEKDISGCVGKTITVQLLDVAMLWDQQPVLKNVILLDGLNVVIEHYQPFADLLQISGQNKITETVCSHLLKSNCPVTGQPDWASIWISYTGKPISHEQLLKYIISYRQHNNFHEHCVESIYWDILTRCKPEKLTVYARYMRRGGLDINPLRSNDEHFSVENFKSSRQ